MPIPCPHFNLIVVTRGKSEKSGSSHATAGSAVAKAAYQSGEKLYSEYDHETKNYAKAS